MKQIFQYTCFILATLFPYTILYAKSNANIIQIDSGMLKGSTEEDVSIFRGIPYATAPIDELRWSPPQNPLPWEGIFDAAKFGNVCPQNMSSHSLWKEHIKDVGMSEDCLSLNIWSSSTKDKNLKPVMMYMHGGTMKRGSGSFGVFDGRHLAKKDVVLVTINYRIGILGRFAHPSMFGVLGRKPLVNYGLLDQVAALKWIKSNIDKFGGDPDNITIFGHSAGGVSVNHLMVMPQSKGLFHKAIAQGSAVAIDNGQHAFKRGKTDFTSKSVEDLGVEFANSFKIEAKNDKETLGQLRAITWQKIIEYQKDNKMLQYMPVVDGKVIIDDVSRIFEQGRAHNVPYMAGTNSWEWSQISKMPFIAKWFMAGAMLDGLSDEDLKPFDDAWTRVGVLHRWFAEGMFLTSTRYLAKKMSMLNSSVWHYHITYVQTNIRGDVPGAAHGMEVAYIFDTARQNPQWQRPRAVRNKKMTQEDLAWGDKIRDYWLNFAKNGNPNGDKLPHWPKYNPKSDITMELGVETKAIKGLNAKTLDYLEKRALIRQQSQDKNSK